MTATEVYSPTCLSPDNHLCSSLLRMSSCPLASRAASAKKFPVLKPHLFSCPADLMAMAPMAQRSLLCPLAPSGMIPLAHGDDLAKVSTCVPPLTQTTLVAVRRTLQSRMGLRGSVTNISPPHRFLSLPPLDNTLQHPSAWTHVSSQLSPGPQWALTGLGLLGGAGSRTLVLEHARQVHELPCLLIMLIHGCLPPCQSASTAGGWLHTCYTRGWWSGSWCHRSFKHRAESQMPFCGCGQPQEDAHTQDPALRLLLSPRAGV